MSVGRVMHRRDGRDGDGDGDGGTSPLLQGMLLT
jgi:hypothetical protein